jgi:glucose 1-dehydrogenase
MPDIVMERTGAPMLIGNVLGHTAAAGIVCLTGVSNAGHAFNLDIGWLNRTLVLDHNVVFGSVNANRRHYVMAADALVRADGHWLDRLITRRLPLDRRNEALEAGLDDVKVIIEFPQT